MAIRPSVSPSQSTASVFFTPANGYQLPKTETGYATAPYPVPNPPQLLGTDYVSAVVNGIETLTFPNLPIRGTGLPISSIQNQPQTLTIDVGDLLLFEVSSQDGVVVRCRVVDTNNTPYQAPALGNGTYKTFQAIVTTTSPQSVIIWGKLYICRGYQVNG